MKKLLVEAIGTGLLAFTVILSSGDAVAVASILAISILAFGGISGAHFNISVTAAMWSRGEISCVDAIKYSVAQVVGALIAIAVVNTLTNNPIFNIGSVTGGEIASHTWFVEFLASAVLLTAIFACIRNKISPAWGVGLAHLVLVPLGFMINTSITVATFFNGGALLLLAIIVVAQIVGGIGAEKLDAKLNSKK